MSELNTPPYVVNIGPQLAFASSGDSPAMSELNTPPYVVNIGPQLAFASCGETHQP